jgi:hypothetical protein
MGRGRAKAKQTKVARELKYSTTGTDLDRLQAELSGSSVEPAAVEADDTDTDEDDPYAEYAGDDEDYEDRDDEDEPARR